MKQALSRRAWLLYACMAVLWGIPYLFIKEAVESFSPAAIVAGRTLLGALILLPFALRSGALRAAWKKWPWVLAFAAVEMAGPFFLLAWAEQTISSGLTGLLVATVPLFGALIAFSGGDRTLLRPLRLTGLLLGFAGVAVIVSGQGFSAGDASAVAAVGAVFIVAICYAVAPYIVSTKLADVPSLGSVTLSLIAVAVLYVPIAAVTQNTVPTVSSAVSLALLGILCTALAFLGFFALIREVGPARAPLFTYINPIVAIVLGIVLLGEDPTLGLLVGFPLVLVGCWLAATGGTLRMRREEQLPEPTIR